MSVRFRSGFGFGKGHTVSMDDGSVKLIEHVCVGDRVISPKYTSIEVIGVKIRVDMLYIILPEFFPEFVVSKYFLFSLVRSADFSPFMASLDQFILGIYKNVDFLLRDSDGLFSGFDFVPMGNGAVYMLELLDEHLFLDGNGIVHCSGNPQLIKRE